MRHLVTLLMFSSVVSASSIYTVNSTVTDGPVSATATLNLSGGSLFVTLTNLQTANFNAAGQLVSDVIIGGLTGTTLGFVDDSSVDLSNGTTAAAGWGGGVIGTGGGTSTFEICIICPSSIQPSGKTAPPTHLIIADGATGGNASVGTHSPSIVGSATFEITGVTNSDVSALPLSISFGTDATEITATPPGGGGGISSVPEPSTWMFMASGIALVGFGKMRLRRS